MGGDSGEDDESGESDNADEGGESEAKKAEDMRMESEILTHVCR